MQKLTENLASGKGQVVWHVQHCIAARRNAGWVTGGLVRRGFESQERGLMWKGSC